MIGGRSLLATLCGRLAALLGLILLAASASSAQARALDVERDLCHAVTDTTPSDDALHRLRFVCHGAPQDYQGRSLWLRISLDARPVQDGLALMLHNSRFDRLAVGFSYACLLYTSPSPRDRG